MNPVARYALIVGGYVALMAWIGLLMAAGLYIVTLLPPIPIVGGVLILAVVFGALWFGLWSFFHVLRPRREKRSTRSG